jgi:hypothetical protein
MEMYYVLAQDLLIKPQTQSYMGLRSVSKKSRKAMTPKTVTLQELLL